MNTHKNTSRSRLRVGILGGNGYTGRELTHLVAAHDGVEIVFSTSRSSAGAPTGVPGLVFTEPDEEEAREADLLFLCLPHGDAAAWVERVGRGPRIIDLTADHRPGSGREEGAVYGIAEREGARIAEARLVANPGCYPTGVILALAPLLDAGVVDRNRLTVVNAASGVTGAGRTPRADLLFAEVHGNFKAYGEGNVHRHRKEMMHTLGELELLFQPHLLPVARGILETIVLPVGTGVNATRIRELWEQAYTGCHALRVLPEGIPELASVVGTDRLHLGVVDVQDVADPVVTVVAALDNLGKGAAGQAVQNMNLMYGWDRERGVRC